MKTNPATTPTPEPSAGRPDRDCPLSVGVQLVAGGPVVAREPVRPADLLDAKAEVWLASCLRCGCPDIPLAAVPMRVTPVYSEDRTSPCVGFRIEATNPRTHAVTRRAFTIHSLSLVARRVSQRLLATGQLKDGQSYYFSLAAEAAPDPPGTEDDLAGAAMVVKMSPLRYRRLPLPPLLLDSRLVGNVGADDSFPVFITETAYTQAERFSRKGAQRQPPVETGCVLVATLGACPETGEFFAVVLRAIEVQDSDEKPMSLLYTGASWQRLTASLRAMQQAHPDQALRLVGQAHGHNFLPGERCPDCPKRARCGKSSAVASADDRLWMRAVFPQQPFGLCWIFGLTARHEPVDGLFHLRDGQLVQRNFRLLRRVPTEWTEDTAQSPD